MSYEWAKMKEGKSAGQLDSPYKNEVGVLMFQIGCAVNMQYGGSPLGSSSPSANVPTAMAIMGYLSGALIDYDFAHIVLSISRSLPVYISATSENYELSGKAGHAWVIDNYMTQLRRVELLPGVFYQASFPYVHCNLGWDGDCDGWYLSGIFNTWIGPASLDDADSKSLRREQCYYQYQQKIIPYIQPIR
jgi:hypothetical protein